ncbi:pentapeptide repeat-containing protein [Nocardia sp. NPDC049190]|uniref:pentapeptide repeat-containing protein n=1 Tax=Nocardia sp. NPDC049190 TaxID=3155650 RepID=UPI0033F16554
MAREFHDLPYAQYLTAPEGVLEPEGDYDCVRVDGGRFDELDVQNARFSQSVFTSTVITGGSMRYTRFADVWLRDVRWVGTELADTFWMDGELVSAAFSGVDFAGANLRRMRFEGCKFDSVTFRAARLREVSFIDCVLCDCDFGDAALTNITIPGSRLGGLSLHRARLSEVDLRGASTLDIIGGLDSLRGATISTMQLIDLAPAFARAVGITVTD